MKHSNTLACFCLAISCLSLTIGVSACEDNAKPGNGVDLQCEPNEHLFDGKCEEDTLEHCGEQRVGCASHIDGWVDGICSEHQCRPTQCAEGKHIYQDTCEPDSATACGSHDVSCYNAITGWLKGTCQNGACIVSQCDKGLHVDNNACKADDIENCSGSPCASQIEGWVAGTCDVGLCNATACIEGMHPSDGRCEHDSAENCGSKGYVCKDHVLGWDSGSCTNGQCQVTHCVSGYHLDAQTKSCVLDTNTCCGDSCKSCTEGRQLCVDGWCSDMCPSDAWSDVLYCDGECVYPENDPRHCGGCGHDCNSEKTEGVQLMGCTSYLCTAGECQKNYHLEMDKNEHLDAGGNPISIQVCAHDTVEACGQAPIVDCASTGGWDGGECLEGACVPNACKGDYHLAQNESGVNWCEPNSNENCGSHGTACSDGLSCAGGRCLGDTECNGAIHNTIDDLDHCGECNHKCDEGLICSNGTCQAGKGEMYCDGKVINSRKDSAHCGSCGNLCPVGQYCSYGDACLPLIEGITTYCAGIQRDLRNDSLNCGQCGKACDMGQTCIDGSCANGTGTTYCNGLRFNTTSDLRHCGKCNNSCQDEEVCSAGTCQTGKGQTYCSGLVVDTNKDTLNCGHCNSACTAGNICNNGICTPGAGPTNCNGDSVDTATNVDHCGSCNNRCNNGLLCIDGSCESSGNYGVMYCNGLKVDISKDSANCGYCGKHCENGQICDNGRCVTDMGTTQCNGNVYDTSKDSGHCGQCDNACTAGNKCQNGECKEGTGDLICNGAYSVKQNNDSENCGQCGNACAKEEMCKEGTCTGTDWSVGSTLVFGNYQNRPIHWRILDNDTANHRVMLLAMDSLDSKPYNTHNTNVTWANSTIRSWLNGYAASENTEGIDYTTDNFITRAFTSEERERIPRVNVENETNAHGLFGGANTSDYVFLLSIDEVFSLISTNANTCSAIHCTSVYWWLRSPGSNYGFAAGVYGLTESGWTGSVNASGISVDNFEGVHPAIWLNY